MTQLVSTSDHHGRPYETLSLAPAVGTYSHPYEALIFIGVTKNQDFFFANALSSVLDFRWSRWSKWRHLLQPYTFHCFKVAGYKTHSQSGHGFRPLEHICEFPGIRACQLFNYAYLDRWQEFHDLSVEAITRHTAEFIAALEGFASLQDAYTSLVQEHLDQHLTSPETRAALAHALEVTHHPFDPHSVLDTDFFGGILQPE